jgi:hypothetical protein
LGAGAALGLALAGMVFFRRTGAGLRLIFFAAMTVTKVKAWPRGGK